MNTGPLRPAVATALTVYGIETNQLLPLLFYRWRWWLQQHLPFTVLKHCYCSSFSDVIVNMLKQQLPFTVCAEGCEAAEEQSDDEVHTLQVPE